MAYYRVRFRDASEVKRELLLACADEASVRKFCLSKGYTVDSIQLGRAREVTKVDLPPSLKRTGREDRDWLERATISATSRLHFTRNLGLLINAGIPLLRSIETLSKQADDPTSAEVIWTIHDGISSGHYLSQSCSLFPRIFPAAYIRILQTGELTGQLHQSIESLAFFLERQGKTQQRVTGALVYPAFLVVASFALVLVMVYGVFPMILKVTGEMGVNPPPLTKALIAVASPWTALLAGLLMTGCIVGARALVRNPSLGPKVRLWLETSTPPGKFYTSFLLLQSLRQLSLLLRGGVDLLKAVAHVREVSRDSVVIEQSFEALYLRVRSGQKLSESLQKDKLFGRTLTSLISVAEETGNVDVLLGRYCDMLEEALNDSIETLSSVIEPVVLSVMGIVIGTILLASFAPLYSLASL
jgi:type IV pilus assembly protein PilC